MLHVLVAGTEQHPPTGGMHLGRQLGDETALAHPRLGRHDHEQRVPGDRDLPSITEQIEFGDPPDEAIGIGQELQRRWQQRCPDQRLGRRASVGAADEVTPIGRVELAKQ